VNGDTNGHTPEVENGDGDGAGLDREVLDSLARAVRLRIRASLANGGSGTTAVGNGADAEPDGHQPGEDAPPLPPEADRGPTP
jgi:hypothetical protein